MLKLGEWVVNVGAEAAYAIYVELGTRRMQAQSYLYPSIVEYLPTLEQLIKEAIELAKQGVVS